MSDDLPARGGCNCGAVRYELTAEPLTSYLCHCHLCQKRTGSAFSMSVVIPRGGLAVTAGEPERSERALPGGGANVSWACGQCHSRIWTETQGRPTANLRAGTLDDPSWIAPVAQFWTASAQPWAIQHCILSYEEQPTDFRPLLDAWRTFRSARR